MARKRFILGRRCSEGKVWLHPYENCPDCGTALEVVKIRARATLVSNTTVRVNPTGSPIQLGIAVTAGGGATLCIVEDGIRGNGRDRVRLVMKDGRFRAVTRGARHLSFRFRSRKRNPRNRRVIRTRRRHASHASY